MINRNLRSWTFIACWLCVASSAAGEDAVTGPETENRFPPLRVPDGFRATLFACDPLVEYPSVIALGPESGTLFVAYDYMTGLGSGIVRRDEIRIVRDRDGDGYADDATVYAEGFNSIQGLAFREGTVFVMHAPLLTALSDTDRDGVADQRRDLLQGLGLPPEQNANRLHCANGVVVGHDGWLYLALGDRGCDVARAEGDRLLVQEGGILRCRFDGSGLHVFSRGLRNIYDVGLDEELNVFVRDNENDGGDYMIRVCHCFHGSDHGYPYLYYEHPQEAMPPRADLGRGSSAGGAAYLETAFPQEYRDSVFFCEWGRAVVRYRRRRAGGGFAPMSEIDFAAGAPDDLYSFKPTDLVVDRDGSLLVSDWGDDQRPKRGRGRIYRISYPGAERDEVGPNTFSENSNFGNLIRGLNSASYHVRVAAQAEIERRGHEGVGSVKQAMQRGQIESLGRLHAVWIITRAGGDDSIGDLFHLAESDSNPRVRAQAVRAIGDRADPILTTHRLGAGRGDESVCRRLAELMDESDPRVRLEIVVALGRLRWLDAPARIRRNWTFSDSAMSHAAMQLLRRADNWPAVLDLLDEPEQQANTNMELRTIALRALAGQANQTVVDGLIARAKQEPDPQRRSEYFDALTRVYKKPEPWTYWGFRPAPRPANSVVWEKSELIAMTLDRALSDPDPAVRVRAVREMLREKLPIRLQPLTRWLREDASAEGVTAILEALRARTAAEARDLLEVVVRSETYVLENRLTALTMLLRDSDAAAEDRLIQIAGKLDEGPVLAATIRELADRPNVDSSSLLMARLNSENDEVRAAAIEALAQRPVGAVAPRVVGLLSDHDVRIRRAAATLAGELQVTEAADRLLERADDPDRLLRSASLKSLTLLRDPRAVQLAVDSLDLPETQLAALAYLARFGSPQYLDAVTTTAEKSRSMDVLTATMGTLASWRRNVRVGASERTDLDHAIARIQGTCVVAIQWKIQGPLTAEAAKQILSMAAKPDWPRAESPNSNSWRRFIAEGTDSRIHVRAAAESAESVWLAITDLFVESAIDVEFFVLANRSPKIWLNRRLVFEQSRPSPKQGPPFRFDAMLVKGNNRLLIELAGKGDLDFHVRFRRKSSKAEHERLAKFALKGRGSVERGRELFSRAEKSQCIKCHRLGQQGERIGPDLTGAGSRYSRIHLIESILEPSRTVATSYETVAVALDDGRVLTGVNAAESETTVALGDNQGTIHEVAKSAIDEIYVQPGSTMPDGLEQRLTDKEFIDLVEFLVSQEHAQPEHQPTGVDALTIADERQNLPTTDRLRLIIETDAGGDPDDEQSLVRFLLYANEWDVEGIIANRAQAREGENRNASRTGMGIVRQLVEAYGDCYASLVQHDARYPSPGELLRRTVSGYADSDDGVNLIVAAVDSPDPRPVWFANWGTDHGSGPSSLKRALDRVLRERGPKGYARFKERLRLSSDDQFGEHTDSIDPPWTLWIDTFRPPHEGKRWYHQFSALTATAGEFDIKRDVRTGHGPLGALYPTNTTHPQKEGDTMTFLYLVPTGMNDPNEPTWGSWGGRYGRREGQPGRPYFWANQADDWDGSTHRDNVLRRWAADLQNDFRARLDWCVNPPRDANHAPVAILNGDDSRRILRIDATAGAALDLDASGSTDRDRNELVYEWRVYPEPGTYRGNVRMDNTTARRVRVELPADGAGDSIHFVLTIRDNGDPPLASYRRVIVSLLEP